MSAIEFRESVTKQIAGQLARRLPNPYRDMPTWQLLDEQEYGQFRLWECQLKKQALTGTETVEFENGEFLPLDYDLAIHFATEILTLIERELTRRRNIIRDSGRRPNLRLEQRRSPDFVAIKDALRIEYVADRMSVNYQLLKRGSRLWTNCFLPGHLNDDTPSFAIDPDKQFFYCFGCGAGGDVIELARRWFTAPTAAQAAELLCGLCGIAVPRTASHQIGP